MTLEDFARARAARWTVKGGVLLTDPADKSSALAISCPHRKQGACGGCYARLYLAMRLIKEAPEAAPLITAEIEAAQKADDAARRLAGKSGDGW